MSASKTQCYNIEKISFKKFKKEREAIEDVMNFGSKGDQYIYFFP